jgi:multiple antibiotic resistance protein
MPIEFLISALVTLLVVVDPIGLVPSYLAVTHGLPQHARRSVALHAALIAAAILIGSALVGGWLLRTLSIGLPAFRIAGGLLLFSIASEMVFGVRTERQSQQAEQAIEEHVRNIAAFPLAIPLMAGPGAITATILLASRSEGDAMRLAILLAVIVIVLVLCFVVLRLQRALPNGSALPPISSPHACSAFCLRRSPCNTSSTACALHWRASSRVRCCSRIKNV